jgi:hypothetical protein
MILRDTEDGEVLYVIDDTAQPPYENRRDKHGRKLGTKPRRIALMSYDMKQIESPVEPRMDEETLIDIAGALIDGP